MSVLIEQLGRQGPPGTHCKSKDPGSNRFKVAKQQLSSE